MMPGLETKHILSDLESQSPGIGSFTITPSTSVIDPPIRSLYCVEAGTVDFIGLDGQVDSWPVPANFIIPVCMQKVTGYTGTTLKGIR